ncbi:hypothetical protein H6P81_011573 [Aristolochia fimbriata]|uniref:ZC3H15/TMA46 family C-terminal domain-containing protein n=1 Tax=Aristolochia fimbriata TaxID=158543 RepID=A0AAV7EWF1_ARIFI|nr:hypothetical protein H6P81_011573 [Aristolochia fimbriata]
MGAEDEKRQPCGGEDGAGTRSNPLLTPSQFLSWKRSKDAAESTRRAEAAQKRAADIASGAVQMNGRELFLHEPGVFDNTRY